MLAEILRGAADKAREAGVVIVGGHTVADEEVKFGMAITGVIDPRRSCATSARKLATRWC